MTGPGIFSYSTTPASNVQANTGINWDEGMSPAAVNNSARQNMTDMRNAFNDLIWFKYGKGDLDYSPVYVASTQFKIAGADVTAVYHVGRCVKAVGSGTGTIYGIISVVAFSTDTTVTVVWDSGSLSNETLTIYISQIPATGAAVPLSAAKGTLNRLLDISGSSGGQIKFPATQNASSDANTLDDYEEGTYTPTDQSGASLTFSAAKGNYVKIGRLCWVALDVTYPATADATQTAISLPFTADSTQTDNMQGLYSGATTSARTDRYAIIRSTATFQAKTTSNAAVQNVSYSGSQIAFSGTYFTNG